MAKKVPAGNANRTAKEKQSHLTFDNQNHQPGWTQAEVDHLVEGIPEADQRVSYPHKEDPYSEADAEKTTDGTAHRTKDGKVLEK